MPEAIRQIIKKRGKVNEFLFIRLTVGDEKKKKEVAEKSVLFSFSVKDSQMLLMCGLHSHYRLKPTCTTVQVFLISPFLVDTLCGPRLPFVGCPCFACLPASFLILKSHSGVKDFSTLSWIPLVSAL